MRNSQVGLLLNLKEIISDYLTGIGATWILGHIHLMSMLQMMEGNFYEYSRWVEIFSQGFFFLSFALAWNLFLNFNLFTSRWGFSVFSGIFTFFSFLLEYFYGDGGEILVPLFVWMCLQKKLHPRFKEVSLETLKGSQENLKILGAFLVSFLVPQLNEAGLLCLMLLFSLIALIPLIQISTSKGLSLQELKGVWCGPHPL